MSKPTPTVSISQSANVIDWRDNPDYKWYDFAPGRYTQEFVCNQGVPFVGDIVLAPMESGKTIAYVVLDVVSGFHVQTLDTMYRVSVASIGYKTDREVQQVLKMLNRQIH